MQSSVGFITLLFALLTSINFSKALCGLLIGLPRSIITAQNRTQSMGNSESLAYGIPVYLISIIEISHDLTLTWIKQEIGRSCRYGEGGYVKILIF